MGPPRRRGGTQMTTTAAKRPIEELRALAEAGARELAGDPDNGVPEANPADVIRWVSRNFDTAACAVACSMADAALPHYVAQYQPGVDEIGRASCRERGKGSAGAVSLQQNEHQDQRWDTSSEEWK